MADLPLPAMRLRLDLPGGGHAEVAAASCVGPRRGNEDNFLLVAPNGSAWRLEDERLFPCVASHWPDGRWLRLAVMDGMGGHEAGRELAAATATMLLDIPPQESPDDMRSMVRRLHADLIDRAGGIGTGGCTLVLADIDLVRGGLTLVNIGDSRAWFRHRGVTHQVTRDSRVVEYAYRDGEIDEAEYREAVAGKTNRLCQALGFGSLFAFSRDEQHIGPELRIDLAGDLTPELADHADALRLAIGGGDTLVLGSDGMLAGGMADGLMHSLSEGADLAALVEGLGTAVSARDNATAVMVRFRPV